MNYNQALSACVDDLMGYPPEELLAAAKHYGIPYTDKRELCKKMAPRIMSSYRVQMPGWEEYIQSFFYEDPDQALLDASGSGDLKKVQALIKAGQANPGVTDSKGNTALLLAASNYRWDIVRALLATGKANLGAQNNSRNTVLMAAVRNGNLEVIKAFLETGEANPAAQNEQGQTALMIAVTNSYIAETDRSRYLKIIQTLLESGQANPGAQSIDGWSALMRAVDAKDLEVVNALLATRLSGPGLQNKDGYSALILAVLTKSIPIVETLLATGQSNIDAADRHGWTALIYAVEDENPEIVRILLDNGANPSLQSAHGDTALIGAAHKGNKEIVQALLATKHANLDAKNTDGLTALMIAKNRQRRLPEKAATFAEIEQMLISATPVRRIEKKTLALPKEGPLWMHLCAKLGETNLLTLRRLAQDLDIDLKNERGQLKDKRRLCYDLAQNYEELLKIEGVAPAEEYKHEGVTCDNDSTLAGEEWSEIPPEDLFVDRYNYCFSFDDLEGILGSDGRHPLSRIPLTEIELKDGSSLLAVYEARKQTRQIGIEEERLKKMRQVHTIITNPTQAMMNKLAELLDEHPGGPGQRNYFEVVTLDVWGKKTMKDYQQFLTSLRNSELVQQYKPVLDILVRLTTPSFSELLEALIQSIRVMPEENKQTYRLLLKTMLEEN